MVYYPRSTSQKDYYNDYPPQTTQASGYSPSHLSPPPRPNTYSRDPQHDSQVNPASLLASLKITYTCTVTVGPIPTSRAPSPTPPRPPPRVQTHSSVNLYARGNNIPRHSESRTSQGNSEQKNRERSTRMEAQDEELKRDEERKKKADEKWEGEEARSKREYNSEKEKLYYRSRMERDRNRPADG
ncbi:uncharacterized protein EAF01_005264 [Botrytis porri]|uniref:uncharacterized protein n=1 Tax=Botrytis porri TaxID=87229 RepID=UPI0018FF93C2|nr:uncharacterized protein EAF01_005264 [Botrytis porri]KAF7907678.1 hypothetical protein EAF01_005264 [Botrytis porri]